MADNDKNLREEIFKRFDANGDGKISSTELGEALMQLGAVSVEEVERMMAEIDTDGDGYISFQEFTMQKRLPYQFSGVASVAMEV